MWLIHYNFKTKKINSPLCCGDLKASSRSCKNRNLICS
nr:MAG TPA: hypothetical protein [Bacteriophage sp.]